MKALDRSPTHTHTHLGCVDAVLVGYTCPAGVPQMDERVGEFQACPHLLRVRPAMMGHAAGSQPRELAPAHQDDGGGADRC